MAYSNGAEYEPARRKAWLIVLGASAALAMGMASRALLAALGIHAPYIAFLPWIVAAGMVMGGRSALLSLAGFVLIGALSLEPTTLVNTRSPLAGLLFFACAGTLLAGISGWINRNVSDRKRAEQAVRRSEQQMRLVTDALPALIAYVDRDARYQFVSKAYERWLNRPLDEIRGKRVADVAEGYEGLRPYVEAALAGRTVHFQVRVTYPDGVTRDVDVTYSPDMAADGVVNGYAVLVIDESDRRKAEQERERLLAAERLAREEAERSGRIKDQFLAVLSHELRTPLTPVLLTVSRLQASGDLPESFREDIASIHRGIELESRLIDDLLDLTRIARGKIRYDFQTVDLHALIRSAMWISCGDGKLSVSVDFGASQVFVHGDPARLQQVFCNLLNNAWKFTPPGGSVAIRSENTDGFIRVDVIDTGSGIDPEVLPRVFDAFEQGDASRARGFGGLGLGLAISKGMVDAHDGRISASSEGHGHGARFRVELPTVSTPTFVGQHPIKLPANLVKQRKLRVLLVEDHPLTLRALEKLLTIMGHEVDGAASVADGLRFAGKGRYDLVISDLGLPDGTGYELMRQIRSTLGLQGIALSGYGMEEDLARSREAGFAEHLVKPIDMQRLQAAIGRIGLC